MKRFIVFICIMALVSLFGGIAVAEEVWVADAKEIILLIDDQETAIPTEFQGYSLKLKVLAQDNFELYVKEGAKEEQLLLKGTTTLKPDEKGDITFVVTEVDDKVATPLFEALGLEASDAYLLKGEFKGKESVLSAAEFGGVIKIKFKRM